MQELQTQMDPASDIKPELLQIFHYPDKVLTLKSVPVLESIPDSRKLQNFIKSLKMTMKANGGIGLSAIQVGVPLSVFVLSVNGEEKTVINPSIKSSSKEMDFQAEGCLSLPLVGTRVRRSESIEVSYFNENGDKINEKLTGLMARAFQHEYDHLLGMTILDRIDDLSKKSFLKKFKKIQKMFNL